jgi:iron complex transport system substrate-binding protein
MACAAPDRRASDASPGAATATALGSAAGEFVDDFGTAHQFATPAQRVVSLTPATTEMLFALGAGARVVGRTTWDQWPAEAAAVADMGPGLRPNVEAVLAARPDLVLLYATEDNRAAARQLASAGVRVLALRVDGLAQFARAAQVMGRALGDTAAATNLRDTVMASIHRVAASRTAGAASPIVAWVLGERPMYVLGPASFLGELVDSAGGRNAFADQTQPSPQIAFEELLRRDPDVLVLSATTAARALRSTAWRGLRAVRDGRVLIADSLATGRPGPRMGEAAHWLAASLDSVVRAHPISPVVRPK